MHSIPLFSSVSPVTVDGMILVLLFQLAAYLRHRLAPILLSLIGLLSNLTGSAQTLPPAPSHIFPQLISQPLVQLSGLTVSQAASSAVGQSTSQTQLPPAPAPTSHPTFLQPTYYPYIGLFCGTGATTSPVATKPTAGCGAGFTFIPIPLYSEVGIMGPQANRSSFSGYVSVDTSIPLARTTSPYLPLVLFGYSRLFETGHALDYGLALVLPKPTSLKSTWGDNLRLELRDYWTFANPNQHNIMLRVGLIGFESD